MTTLKSVYMCMYMLSYVYTLLCTHIYYIYMLSLRNGNTKIKLVAEGGKTHCFLHYNSIYILVL